MDGQGFGAFTKGLAGGYGLGKSINGAMNKPEQPKLTAEATAPAVQQGAQQTLGAADVTMPQLGSAESMGFGADQAKPEEGGFMDKIGGWVKDFQGQAGELTEKLPLNGGIAGGLVRHAGDSVAGKLLAGGPGATILGKLIK